MTIRFRSIVEVHLLLFRENETLLLKRMNTGYCDGMYSVIAGHLDAGESIVQAMIREAWEEAGISIKPENLKIINLIHRNSDTERISFFLTTDKWEGKITNAEPEKCEELRWFRLDNLPENLIPYVKNSLDNYQQGIFYSELGWL